MSNILSWLNQNKSYVALAFVVLFQLANANHWFTVPVETINLVTGFVGGAGLASIPHSNTAMMKAERKTV